MPTGRFLVVLKGKDTTAYRIEHCETQREAEATARGFAQSAIGAEAIVAQTLGKYSAGTLTVNVEVPTKAVEIGSE